MDTCITYFRVQHISTIAQQVSHESHTQLPMSYYPTMLTTEIPVTKLNDVIIFLCLSSGHIPTYQNYLKDVAYLYSFFMRSRSKPARFQAFAAVWMRPSLFWDVTQRLFVVTDVSGQPLGPIFKGQAVCFDYPTLEGLTPCSLVEIYLYIGWTHLLRQRREMFWRWKQQFSTKSRNMECLTSTDTRRQFPNLKSALQYVYTQYKWHEIGSMC